MYLLSSARFLNYKFSPASFWYLYTADLQLKYVIAEVNNTFDERRMYLFPAMGTAGVFQQRSKDFHVSLFNSRKGSYSISTANPADGKAMSVAVTLRSSKGHPKVLKGMWSDAPALDPSTCSVVSAVWFLVCWGWTGLMTCRSTQTVFEPCWLIAHQSHGSWFKRLFWPNTTSSRSGIARSQGPRRYSRAPQLFRRSGHTLPHQIIPSRYHLQLFFIIIICRQ